MKAPAFWYPDGDRPSVSGQVLAPLGWLYGAATQTRLMLATSRKVGAQVVCVGNLTVGGTGKTPLALAINEVLTSVGRRTAFLTRGYAGKVDDATQVLPGTHDFKAVGDEALLLAEAAPTYVSPGRVRGAIAASRDGAEVIIMDDGFQNPALKKDVSFVVIDGPVGWGNRRMIPAGPLRESIHLGLRRADALIVLGDLKDGPEGELIARSGKPVFRASIQPLTPASLDTSKPVVAFAGIGRPEKFFETARALGFQLAEAVPFPDHHAFGEKDIAWLRSLAAERAATLITTSKDYVRLAEDFRPEVRAIPVRAQFDEPEEVESFLHYTLSQDA